MPQGFREKGIIALDGYAGCGKSTLAKDLSQALKMAYIDTGAMYRAVTWQLLHDGLDPSDVEDWTSTLNSWGFHFHVDGGDFIIESKKHGILNEVLRTASVAGSVSRIAAIPAIRQWLVRQQQSLGGHGGVVSEGRDIGTVVFPQSRLKFFVTASLEVRTIRRYIQAKTAGLTTTIDAIRENLQHRDHLDSTREESPLQPAPDSIWLDTTRLSREQQLKIALDLIDQRFRDDSLQASYF